MTDYSDVLRALFLDKYTDPADERPRVTCDVVSGTYGTILRESGTQMPDGCWLWSDTTVEARL